MRPDYCPIGGQPCQSLCVEPCTHPPRRAPEPEPVAWMYVGVRYDGTTHGPHLAWKPQYMDAMSKHNGAEAIPLFDHPPRREWRGLTDEELRDALRECPHDTVENLRVRWLYAKDFARAVEAALKERNT